MVDKSHYNRDVKVSEDTLDIIRELGMAGSIQKAMSGDADAEFIEAVRRFYPAIVDKLDKTTGWNQPGRDNIGNKVNEDGAVMVPDYDTLGQDVNASPSSGPGTAPPGGAGDSALGAIFSPEILQRAMPQGGGAPPPEMGMGGGMGAPPPAPVGKTSPDIDAMIMQSLAGKDPNIPPGAGLAGDMMADPMGGLPSPSPSPSSQAPPMDLGNEMSGGKLIEMIMSLFGGGGGNSQAGPQDALSRRLNQSGGGGGLM